MLKFQTRKRVATHVAVDVTTPKKLTKEQRQLFEKLAATLPDPRSDMLV